MSVRVAIIGAGLAGVTLGRMLEPLAHVEIFEKSRGYGGRMATKRKDGVDFDHGAQYFTVRDPEFYRFLTSAMARGIVRRWSEPAYTLKSDGALSLHAGTSARHVASPKMSSLAGFLAAPLTVHLNTRVDTLEKTEARWRLLDDNKVVGEGFDWVLSAIPSPQTLELMPFSDAHRVELALVRMSACFTLMFDGVDVSALPVSNARIDHPVLGWIAVNSTKPDRNRRHACVVVHSANAWADAHIDRPLEEIKAVMMRALRQIAPSVGDIDGDRIAIHRWRYANVDRPLGEPYMLDAERGLGACGDWCLGNRVENAFQSGRALAQDVLARMKMERAL